MAIVGRSWSLGFCGARPSALRLRRRDDGKRN